MESGLTLRLGVGTGIVYNREDLLSILLNAVHIEPKQILLGAVLKEEGQTSSQIMEELSNNTGLSSHLVPSTPDISEYLLALSENDLIKKTVVKRPLEPAQEQRDPEVELRFRLGLLNPVQKRYHLDRLRRQNEEQWDTIWYLSGIGLGLGRPLSVFTLNYVVQQNQSMYTILGNTKRSDSESPYDIRAAPYYRAKILQSIDQGTNTKRDLVSMLAEEDSALSAVIPDDRMAPQMSWISYYLESFQRSGLVQRSRKYCLTQKGRAFMTNYLTPLVNSLQGDRKLQYADAILNRFDRDRQWAQQICNAAMEIYHAVSPTRNRDD